MHISLESYRKYIDGLNKDFKNQNLYSPILLNEQTFMFPFMNLRNKYLVISLNCSNPLVYVIENNDFFSSFEMKRFSKIKKKIGKSTLKNIELVNNDFVIKIELENEENKLLLIYCELFSKKPEFYLIDNNIVTEIFNEKEYVGKQYSFKNPIEYVKETTNITDSIIHSHFDNEVVIRKKQKYSAFSKFINGKIKSINKKIKMIENDVILANENLKLEEYANEIFTLGCNLKGHYDSICLESGCIKLDESKTLIENIEKFFKKAKKAKETINRSQINIENAKKELDEFNDILNLFNNSNEKEADRLVEMYLQTKKKKEVAKTPFNRPYVINLNGTFIYFGRNASQNDYLSFVMKLNRDFTWLHIKDLSGSHIVIANPKPTENELLFACELALICSKVTTAEIVYTKKKNIRRGHTLGEAILKNYSTVKLNSVRKESYDIFALAKRID